MTDLASRTVGVSATLHRARAAARQVEFWDQRRVDDMVTAVGWACYREDDVHAMSRFAHESTGLGDPDEMYALHRRRVLGVLGDLHGVTTTGPIDVQRELGIVRYAKPVGVITATCPTTAPCATAACIALPALKTRNAIILVPSPRGRAAVEMAVAGMRAALRELGGPVDLVQIAHECTKDTAAALMAAADLVVATGGEQTLKRAYRSGTPTIGAGVGNATVIVDDSADLDAASRKIAFGASYNNGTSCSSESNVLVDAAVAPAFEERLRQSGVYVCDPLETDRLRDTLWSGDTKLNRQAIGRPAAALAKDIGVQPGPDGIRALAVPMPAVDLTDPLFGEKLSPVFTLVTYQWFAEAVTHVQRILENAGSGHSCGIHSRSEARVARFAARIHSARLLVNQSVALGNSGSHDNGLPFTTTVACGSWGGCGHSENITWRHFLNYTTVSRSITPVLPDEDAIFGSLRRANRGEPHDAAPVVIRS